MDSLPSSLADLLTRARSLMGPIESTYLPNRPASVEERLREALSREGEPEKRHRLTALLVRLKEILSEPTPAEAEPRLILEETPLEARLTLVPGSKGKRMDRSRILEELRRRGIREKISQDAIGAACQAVDLRELVYSLKIAEGTPAESGTDTSIEFHVKAFDKRVLLDPNLPFLGDLAAQIETVEAGQRVATLSPPRPGRPGVDIRGNPLAWNPGQDLGIRPGTGLMTAHNGRDLMAVVPGTLVAGVGVLDVVPFRILEGGIRSKEDIDFRGHLLVTGHVAGPSTLRGWDVYIEGNVEEARIQASGDVLVGGSLQAKCQVQSEGLILARHISDATVEALGDVLVRNSIVEGRVTSSGFVRVLSDPGSIEGGRVSGRKGVSAHVVGSDWGIETTIVAGSDVLGDARWPELESGIARCEEDLRSLGTLLDPSLETGADLARLPVGSQEECAEILERAGRALMKLSELKRTRAKFDQNRGDVSRAQIEVRGSLLPPVKLEIGRGSQMFRKRLDRVVLLLAHNQRIRVKEGPPPPPAARPRERKTRTRRRE
jgi:uncharacterized protein (DUF342 family)